MEVVLSLHIMYRSEYFGEMNTFQSEVRWRHAESE